MKILIPEDNEQIKDDDMFFSTDNSFEEGVPMQMNFNENSSSLSESDFEESFDDSFINELGLSDETIMEEDSSSKKTSKKEKTSKHKAPVMKSKTKPTKEKPIKEKKKPKQKDKSKKENVIEFPAEYDADKIMKTVKKNSKDILFIIVAVIMLLFVGWACWVKSFLFLVIMVFCILCTYKIYTKQSIKNMNSSITFDVGLPYLNLAFEKIISNIRGKFNPNIIYTMKELSLIPKNDRFISCDYLGFCKEGLETQFEVIQEEFKKDYKNIITGNIFHGKIYWNCPYKLTILSKSAFHDSEPPKAIKDQFKVRIDNDLFNENFICYSNDKSFAFAMIKRACEAGLFEEIGHTDKIGVEEITKGKKKQKHKYKLRPQINIAIYKCNFFAFVENEKLFSTDKPSIKYNREVMNNSIVAAMKEINVIESIYRKLDNR